MVSMRRIDILILHFKGLVQARAFYYKIATDGLAPLWFEIKLDSSWQKELRGKINK